MDQERLLAIFLICTFPSLMQVKNLSLQAAEFKKYNFLMLNILNCKHFSKVIFCSKFEPKTGVLMKCSVVFFFFFF